MVLWWEISITNLSLELGITGLEEDWLYFGTPYPTILLFLVLLMTEPPLSLDVTEVFPSIVIILPSTLTDSTNPIWFVHLEFVLNLKNTTSPGCGLFVFHWLLDLNQFPISIHEADFLIREESACAKTQDTKTAHHG